MSESESLVDEKSVPKRLEECYANAKELAFDIGDLKMAILADHHRGEKDGADDFLRCKPAYHAALGYYFESGYHLALLGDVEDLWECRPGPVMKAYADTLELERTYVQHQRYLRTWGNHDDLWQYAGPVRKYLSAACGMTTVPAAYRLRLLDEGKALGEIFLVHGYQGTLDSDRFAWFSRWVIRYIWRPFQRLTRIRSTTPATDFKLRRGREMILHAWAARRSNFILITGHTHHPVFDSITHEALLTRILHLAATRAEKAKAAAKLEWAKAQCDGVETHFPSNQKAAYFNTGCCSFSDGDITGIEIEGGEIRLVRWPDDQGEPVKKILASGNLRDILARTAMNQASGLQAQ